MNYFWGALGFVWRRKLYVFITLFSAVLFLVAMFPFSDLSDVVTSAVAKGSRGAVYVTFDTLDLSLLPQPSVAATKLSVETALPALKAEYAEVTPSLVSILLSLPTLVGAARGDQEAAASLSSKLGVTFAARGLLGSDVSLKFGPGSKTESGLARSLVNLDLKKLSLGEVQKWADLPISMSGHASVATDLAFVPDFKEQPDGQFAIGVEKFVLPASVIQVDMNGTPLPVNLPELTLQSVRLRGKLSRGNLTIEEGTFGGKGDAISGRIKGTLGMSLLPSGASLQPVLGSYNLTVEMNTTQMIEKDMGFAFMMLGPGKTPNPGGGAHYLFRAMGQGFGMEYAPNITRAATF